MKEPKLRLHVIEEEQLAKGEQRRLQQSCCNACKARVRLKFARWNEWCDVLALNGWPTWVRDEKEVLAAVPGRTQTLYHEE